VATVFYRLLIDEQRRANWAEENDFSDVAAGEWYNIAVSVMSNMNILQGYEDGSFKPDAPITRAELATIVARFAKLAMLRETKSETDFNDVAGHWAEEFITLAAGLGWVVGYEDGSFKPDQLITRAEFFTLANRVLERIPEGAGDLLADEMTNWSDNSDEGAWYYVAVQEASNSHDFVRKTGKMVPNLYYEYETWTAMRGNPDWLTLEAQWSASYSTP